MSKKGCLITAVIVAIIIIILVACGAMCILFSTALSNVDFDSTAEAPQEEVLIDGGEDEIVVINIEGMIMDVEYSTDLWGSAYAPSGQIVEYIDYAIEQDVSAIILNVDSPGGDVYASDVIYRKIREAQASGIKVVTLMRGLAASGGYYVAAPSDKIVADELTITGSIGVYMQFQSLSGLYDKLGIETRIITNSKGDFKTGEGLFDDDPQGEEDQIYQELVNDAYNQFVKVISEGRGLTEKEINEFGDGRVMSGETALEFNLVDELGGFDKAVELAEKEAGIDNATVVTYKQYDFLSSLMGYVSSVANPKSQLLKGLDAKPGLKLMYLYTE